MALLENQQRRFHAPWFFGRLISWGSPGRVESARCQMGARSGSGRAPKNPGNRVVGNWQRSGNRTDVEPCGSCNCPQYYLSKDSLSQADIFRVLLADRGGRLG